MRSADLESRVLHLENSESHFDLLIMGAGFAGALLARIGAKLGFKVGLLEKSAHPRFAIGESTTPLTNLLLEEISEEFSLSNLKNFSSYTRWQKSNPQITCGLKRGFSFFHHQPQRPWRRNDQNEWLISASPHDGLADTHWYREDLDQAWTSAAIEEGVYYLDHFNLISVDEFSENLWNLCGRMSDGRIVQWRAPWIIDATGPRGALAKLLPIPEASPDFYPTTIGIFSHFRNVPLWKDLHPDEYQNPDLLPFPVDDAAVHHIFNEGWMWALRFNNGVTSAGLSIKQSSVNEISSFTDTKHPGYGLWDNTLKKYLSLGDLFHGSNRIRDWSSANPLPYFSSKITGIHGSKCWTLLPSAASFIDPLLSSGFPLTLLGIQRLGSILKSINPGSDFVGSEDFYRSINQYSYQTRDESNITAKLVAKMLLNLDKPRVFQALTRFYFVAASYSEIMRRLHRPEQAEGFLLSQKPEFRLSFENLIDSLPDTNEPGWEQKFQKWSSEQLHALHPFDVMGMTNTTRSGRFSALASDLLNAADRIGVSKNELQEFLVNSGFYNSIDL